MTNNCDQDPMAQCMYYNETIYHRKYPNFVWDSHNYKLELLKIKTAVLISGRFTEYIEARSAANVNLWQWLKDNQDLIPKEWEKVQIAFIGTVCIDSRVAKNYQYYTVRVLRNNLFFGKDKDPMWSFGQDTLISILNSKTPYYVISIP